MNRIFCVLFAVCSIYGALFGAEKKEPDTNQILQCNAIFEARKNEIKEDLRLLNEKMQNLEAYKNATQNLLEQKEAKLKEQESALESKIKEIQASQKKAQEKIDQEKKAIENLIAKNEEILKQIKSESDNKVAKTFSGMKDSKAAPIIAELDDVSAAEILSSLSSAEMAKVLAKMDSKRAAELTKIIAKGPPFKSSKSTTTSESQIPGESPKQDSKPKEEQSNQLKFQEDGGI